MIKCIVLFIPGMAWNIIIKLFVWLVLFNSSRFNTGGYINNNLFLWYITANGRSFSRFNCLYVTPWNICCTNTKNLWCDSTCNKINNLGERKLMFLMPQMTVAITNVFAFPYKSISIKWTNLIIKVSILSPKQVKSYIHLLFRWSWK